MEHRGNVVVVVVFLHSVANIDVARLPEGTIRFEGSVDDPTVLGNSDGSFGLHLGGYVAQSEFPYVLRAERILAGRARGCHRLDRSALEHARGE